MITIVWFRQDLRIRDNPAVFEAARRGPVLPVYILDDATPGKWRWGGASRWWLHHSLSALAGEIGGLLLLRGDGRRLIPGLAARTGADAVYWNRCYEPHAIERDKALKAALLANGIEARSFNASLLVEPWEVATGAGEPFKVFTPFWRSAGSRQREQPLPKPPKIRVVAPRDHGVPIDDLGLLPTKPNWALSWERLWKPGEEGATAALSAFLKHGIEGYGDLRNRPDLNHVSRLSPHLHWGEISPRQIAAAIDAPRLASSGDRTKFMSEIGWREFAHHLLFHYPDLPERNWRRAFDAYPWDRNPQALRAWQKGMTGYPFVDAGMRELWRTGWMHNRVRMAAASFLIKHLRVDWRAGQDWFWDTLVDADLANNAASWQWVAGSGADAAPYFRIFNPVTQGRKFDPDGTYVRRWCPELARLPAEFIHAPFEASPAVLEAAGVRLGETYPHPIVDHAKARAAALAGFEATKLTVPAAS